MDFEELGLIELVVDNDGEGIDQLPEGLRNDEAAMAEAIENNVRKTIIDENPVNPKYYEQMSVLLGELIEKRRKDAINYQEYLEEIKKLAKKVVNPAAHNHSRYPESMDTTAKQALYDNLEKDEVLVTKIDSAVRYTKKDEWLGDRFKEREIANSIREETSSYNVNITEIMDLIKAQKDYH